METTIVPFSLTDGMSVLSSVAAPSGFLRPGLTSLQIDSLGTPHIAFQNTMGNINCYLRYAYFTGSTWVVETVDAAGYYVGWSRVSMVLDKSSYPHIAYMAYLSDDWNGAQLRYAHLESNGVTVPTGVETTFYHTGTHSLQTSVQIPSGAVTETMELVFTERDYASHSPAGYAFSGQGFQIEAYQTDGTHASGYVFNTPITITVEYTNSAIALVSDENSLQLYYWNETSWSTDGISIVGRDLNANQITATTTHLSHYAMFGKTNQVFLPLVMKDP
jgi:hypothetical protein